jgi:hypothetical protein
MGDGRTVPRLATFLGRRSGDTNSDTTKIILGRHRTSNDLSEKEYVSSLFEGTRSTRVWIDVFVWFFLRGVNA